MARIAGIPAILCLLCRASVAAQSVAKGPVEMADGIRADGKIYVVVLTLALILSAVLLYLIRLDVKISRFEKEQKGE